MKEKDVRDRINAFLRHSLQHLVVPASMGIGLALGACNTSGLTTNSDGSGDSSTLQPRSGGAGGGLGGSGGTLYGIGGSMPPAGGAGGSGGAGGLGGATGTAYGLGGSTTPRTGGAAGGLGGSGGTLYGIGGSIPRSGGAGGGLTGTGGSLYGMGGFRDAGPSGGGGAIDSGAVPEAGKREAALSPDIMVSETGFVKQDAKDTSPRDGFDE